MWRVKCVLFTPRRLQQMAISCTRSDYNKLKKYCQSVTLSSLAKKSLQQVVLFYDAALSRAQRCLTLMIFMSSTRNRSTAATMMCWMKKTTDAISDTARKESVQVALLQTHGEDGAILFMLRWSLIGVSSVHFVQMCWERSTNSFCISCTRRTICDRWNLSGPPRPSGCIFLQFDQFGVASHVIFNLSGNDREFLQNSFWCISFLNYGR